MPHIPFSHCPSLFKGHPEVFQVPPAQNPTWNVDLCNWTFKGSQRNPRITSIKIPWDAQMGRKKKNTEFLPVRASAPCERICDAVGSYFCAVLSPWGCFYILEPLFHQDSLIPLFSTLLGWNFHQELSRLGLSKTKLPLKAKFKSGIPGKVWIEPGRGWIPPWLKHSCIFSHLNIYFYNITLKITTCYFLRQQNSENKTISMVCSSTQEVTWAYFLAEKVTDRHFCSENSVFVTKAQQIPAHLSAGAQIPLPRCAPV